MKQVKVWLVDLLVGDLTVCALLSKHCMQQVHVQSDSLLICVSCVSGTSDWHRDMLRLDCLNRSEVLRGSGSQVRARGVAARGVQ